MGRCSRLEEKIGKCTPENMFHTIGEWKELVFKEPGIKEPTTKPGEGDKWRTIKRPKVDPRPKAKMDRPRPSYRRRGMFR